MRNWYKKIKISQQVSSLDSPGNRCIDKVHSDEPALSSLSPAASRFREGMIVKDRRRWRIGDGSYGKIDKIKNGKIKILWFDNNKQKIGKDVFDINQDTIELNMLITEG
ncbi:MAG: hypothetical protein ACOCRX_11460 [Candidatus Woesearchaeota archaeon]